MTRIIFCLLLLTLLSVANANQQPPSLDQQELQRFGLAISQVKSLYVDESDDRDLFGNAIRGMLKGLDPHSTYLDESDLENMKMLTSGEFGGVGIQISTEHGLVKVISPIDDTPANKAGIKAGDYILGVDGKSLLDMPLDKAVMMMRGKPGTELTLTILNKEEMKPRDVTLKRAEIALDSVKSRLLPGQYGYIRISHFSDNTATQVEAALKQLNKESNGQLKGLVLDLRNNPGGLLKAAVDTTNIFLDSRQLADNKKIVYTESRIAEAEMVEYAKPGDLLNGAPLVILINRGSASASEIVSGALQDHKRSVVIGEKSFGKGSVQTILPLDSKTAVKLTTALYYTPSGRSIQASGIVPDIFVADLKIDHQQGDKEEAIFLQRVREADLEKHLVHQSDDDLADQEKQMEELSNQLKEVAAEDYQLYSAITVLQSMQLFKQRLAT